MKLKNIFVLFAIFLPVSVAGRFFQLLSLTDPATGFFLTDASAINLFMCGAFGVFGVFLFVCAFLCRQYPVRKPASSPALAVFSLILALSMLVDLGSLVTGGDLNVLKTVQCVLLLLSAAVFCIYAVWNFTGLQVNVGGLMMLPVVLWMVRLVNDFIALTGMANISENIIRVLAVCASMVFLLGHGKLIGGLGSEKNMRLTVSCGMLAAVFGLMSTVPRYVLYVVDATKLHEGAVGDPMDLALGMYIIVFLLVMLKGEKKIEA